MPVLTVKSRYLPLIRSGRKTSTIRLTSARVKAGDLLTFTDYRTSVRTICTDVCETCVRDLRETDAQSDGFDSLDDLLDALRSHYALTLSARVFVIRFALNDSPQSALAFD